MSQYDKIMMEIRLKRKYGIPQVAADDTVDEEFLYYFCEGLRMGGVDVD